MKNQTQKTITDIAMIQSPKILTVQQVAELLQIPRSGVYEKTRRRRGSVPPLPSRRIGKYLRFEEGEVLAWFNAIPHSRRAA